MRSFLSLPDGPCDGNITSPPTPKKRGRPGFRPTKEGRERVLYLAKFGIRHNQIVAAFGIDSKTLRKHLRRELAHAAAESNPLLPAPPAIFTVYNTDGEPNDNC